MPARLRFNRTLFSVCFAHALLPLAPQNNYRIYNCCPEHPYPNFETGAAIIKYDVQVRLERRDELTTLTEGWSEATVTL